LAARFADIRASSAVLLPLCALQLGGAIFDRVFHRIVGKIEKCEFGRVDASTLGLMHDPSHELGEPIVTVIQRIEVWRVARTLPKSDELAVIGIHDLLAAPVGKLKASRGRHHGDRDHECNRLGVFLDEGRLIAIPKRAYARMDRHQGLTARIRRRDLARDRHQFHQLAAMLEKNRRDFGDYIGWHLLPRKQKLLDGNGLFVAARHRRSAFVRPLRNAAGCERRVPELQRRGLGNGNDPSVDFLDEAQDRCIAGRADAKQRVDVAVHQQPISGALGAGERPQTLIGQRVVVGKKPKGLILTALLRRQGDALANKIRDGADTAVASRHDLKRVGIEFRQQPG
jgi:hypothetical protein